MSFDISSAITHMERNKLSGSLGDFFTYFWDVNNSTPLSYNWHVDYLCEVFAETLHGYLDDKRRYKKVLAEQSAYERKHGIGTYDMPSFKRTTKHLLINIPPRSSKSMISSVCFPVWGWTKDKSLNYICVSYNEQLALFLAGQSMRLIRSDKFMSTFGKNIFLGDNTAVGNFSLGRSVNEGKATGRRRSVGLGGTVTGIGGDIIIVDDPIKPMEAGSTSSDKSLESCIEFYNETLISRHDEPAIGVNIVIMQRLHEKDLSGHILDSVNSDTYEHICLPAEIKSTYSVVRPEVLRKKYKDGVLWPNRYPYEHLQMMKSSMGDAYYGQMNQTPVNPEGSLIKRSWLRTADFIPEGCGRNLIFLDPAYTEEKHNNPTGIIVCTVDYHKKAEGAKVSPYGILYVVSAQEVRYEFHRLTNHILQLVSEYTKAGVPPAIYIEPKASGMSIYQGLRKAIPACPVFQIQGDIVNKKDKRGRLAACSLQIENGNLVFLKDNTDTSSKNWNKLLEDQLCTFPYSKNDDLIDCISYAFYITHKSRTLRVESISVGDAERNRQASIKEGRMVAERGGEQISLRPKPSEGDTGQAPSGQAPSDPNTVKGAIDKALGKMLDFNN